MPLLGLLPKGLVTKVTALPKVAVPPPLFVSEFQKLLLLFILLGLKVLTVPAAARSGILH